jgi:hypothetical protein
LHGQPFVHIESAELPKQADRADIRTGAANLTNQTQGSTVVTTVLDVRVDYSHTIDLYAHLHEGVLN